jgi:hypothetical protein
MPRQRRVLLVGEDDLEGTRPSSMAAPRNLWSWRPSARLKYLELCARLPEELRRYIVISMRRVPENLMTSRIEERVRDLRRFCRAVMRRVELARRNFDQFAGVPLHAIAAELAAAGAIERQAMAAMHEFLDALTPRRIKSFVEGLSTKSLVIAALASGFDYLLGSAIITETRTLGVRAFSIPDLHETLAGGVTPGSGAS